MENYAPKCSEKIGISDLFVKYRRTLHAGEIVLINKLRNRKERREGYVRCVLAQLKIEHSKYDFRELERTYCDPSLLDIPGDIVVQKMTPKKTRLVHYIHNNSVRTDISWETLKNVRQNPSLAKKSPDDIRNKRYIKVFDEKGKEENLKPYEDVVITVRVYKPFHFVRKKKCLKYEKEFIVLGWQKLTVLRDLIECREDYVVAGDVSENPDDVRNVLAKEKYQSGFFFFGDTFYNDMRNELNVDYSKIVTDWAKNKSNIGPFKTAKMEDTQFKDLNISLGYPYVYQHQGNCEHLVVFSCARLLRRTDSQDRIDYPRITKIAHYQSRRCEACSERMASVFVRGQTRTPLEKVWLCRTCFMSYYYVKGEKIGTLKAYRIMYVKPSEIYAKGSLLKPLVQFR